MIYNVRVIPVTHPHILVYSMSCRFNILKVILAASMMLPFSSCHKNAYYDDSIYTNRWPKENTRKKESNKPATQSTTTKKSSPSQSPNIPEEWRTLELKLNRQDNKELYRELKSWLGTPYKYAGMEKGVGCDCSGLTMQVYLTVYNKKIDRNSSRQFTQDCREITREELREGDLVFFNGNTPGRITHVGIYLKDGYFAHASSSSGVVVSSLDQRYYVKHFQCAGRVK